MLIYIATLDSLAGLQDSPLENILIQPVKSLVIRTHLDIYSTLVSMIDDHQTHRLQRFCSNREIFTSRWVVIQWQLIIITYHHHWIRTCSIDEQKHHRHGMHSIVVPNSTVSDHKHKTQPPKVIRDVIKLLFCTPLYFERTHPKGDFWEVRNLFQLQHNGRVLCLPDLTPH
ncbi:hypothetical protein CEXT_428091 [Caerostris extrusa]|uniref:Maturase K n=1 Tax=Caerostris extrusa TaxID=172846 RepID=A0AAV4Y8Q9_CAEEX|nr:hypothetical protein CEXT_428091 [Caerostris extrusa]